MFATKVVIEDFKPQSQMSSDYNKARAYQIQNEINKYKVDIDHTTFKKDKKEKEKLKLAKLNYNVDPERGRDDILKDFIECKIPNWNFSFIVK